MKKYLSLFIVCGLMLFNFAAFADHQVKKAPDGTPWYQVLGAAVLSSPHLGVRTQYDGSHLISNSSPVNKDVALLELEQVFDMFLHDHQKDPHKNIIEISGDVRGEGFVQDPYTDAKNNDIDLTMAQVDVYARVSPWVKGFMAINYDNALPAAVITRTTNSRFALDSGFIMLGNFNRSPWYMSVGQIYVPFGQYNTYMITDPLTEALGLIQTRALVFGYKHHGPDGVHASVYGFHGDSKVGINTNLNRRVNHWGADLGFRQKFQGGDFDIVASYINNITDSNGMQANGGAGVTGFTGFGASGATAVLVHRVPAIDARASLDIFNFFAIAEWIGTTRHFDLLNMTFNDSPANPSAWHAEVGYNWKWYCKPMGLVFGYDATHDVLALNIPKQQYGVTLTGIFWRETVLKLEYRHDRNYAVAATATGAGLAFVPAAGTLGKSRDTVTTQLTMYF